MIKSNILREFKNFIFFFKTKKPHIDIRDLIILDEVMEEF
jgi:hypothetical protein